jgi:hypothetical protein
LQSIIRQNSGKAASAAASASRSFSPKAPLPPLTKRPYHAGMESIVRNVRGLDAGNRQSLETLLGRRLGDAE